MIHVHHWSGLSVGSRRSHVQEWEPGLTVADVVGDLPGHALRNSKPCERTDELSDWDHVDVVPPVGEAVALSVIVSYAVSWAVQKLLPAPQPAKERNDERSPTYGFSRMKNIRVEGQPIPVVYGEHRLAGTIVNEFVEVNNVTGESTYFALVCVSQGPITAIGGETTDTPSLEPLRGDDVPATIYINDNPLSNFPDTKAWVRLGSIEQELIPGFDKAKTTVELNALLEQREGDSDVSVIPVNEYGNGVDYEDIWDEYGFSYDTSSADVDGLEVVINFPQGLYTTDSLGQAIPSWFMLAIRWCRLDSGGTPILGAGNGGNANDGWVREPIEQFNLERQSPFQLSFPISFYDPLDHSDPSPGDAWRAPDWDAGDAFFRTDIAVDIDGSAFGSSQVPVDWQQNGYASQFAFEAWVALEDAGTDPFKDANISGEFDYVPLFEWSGSGGDENGVFFGFKRIKKTSEWIPYMRVGKWSRVHEWPAADIQPTAAGGANKVWHHLLWSHKRIDSSTNRTELWVNGTYLGAQYGNTDIIIPGSTGSGSNDAPMKFGRATQILTEDFGIRGWWDQVVVWARAFGQPAALARYNGGEGQVVNGTNPDVVLSYSFDGASPAFIPDASIYGNHGKEAGSVGGATIATGEGIVSTKVSPERLRGRYRVECMRANEQEDAASGAPRIDGGEWQLAITWLDEAFTHPGAALYGVQVGATEQMNTSTPDLTAVVKGRPVQIWDGISTTNPRFVREWTRNPVWIAIDAATDNTYGGGHIFKLENVNVETAKEVADIADTVVYDGRAQREFYRQEYESNANSINSPEAFANAAWSTVSCSISSNDTTAPDGSVSADTLTDSSAGVSGYLLEASLTEPNEPTWLALSCFVAKDATATTYSGALYIDAGTATIAIFNLDDGSAIQNCSVESYNDDWWLVKVDPVWSEGGAATGITLRLYPSAYNYGTSTQNIALQEAMTAWGVMLNRGRTHLDYITYNETPRAYLYMGDRDALDAAQTLPTHWAAGYKLRLRDCNDASWDTSATDTEGLEIQEVEVLNTHDGYRRSWRIVCFWPSSLSDPGSTFPQLVVGGANWEDLAGDWVSSSGSTASVEFDDGGTTGGPTTADPLLSDVVNVTAVSTSSPGLILQTLTAFTGAKIRARALVFKPASLLAVNFAVEDSTNGKTGVSPSGDDEWLTVEVEHVSGNAVPDVLFECYEDTSDEGWADGIGAYLFEDASGNAPGGTIEGAEALFEYDGVHDTFKDIWATISDICVTARAIPVREGNSLRFKADYARDPVGLIGMASTILEGENRSTFRVRYSNKRQRANAYSIDFADRDQNWDRATAEKLSDDLDASASGDVRQENFFLQGVTRRSQVLRHAKYLLAQNELLTRDGSLSAGPGSIAFEPADVIELGHDIMPWGQSGRCSVSSSPSVVNLITFDYDSFDQWALTSGDVDVTANVMPNDVGDPVADKVETLVDAQVSLVKDLTGILNNNSYVFSVKVKAKVPPPNTGILLQQTAGTTVLADYNWAANTLSLVSGPSGITLTKTELEDGWFRLGVEIETKNTNAITCSILPARGTGDLSGKIIYLADAQLERDVIEPTAYHAPGVGIYCDRKVILENGITYLCRVTSNATGVSGTADVLSGDGEYLPGDLISVNVATLGFQPLRGDEYIIFSESQRMKAQLLSLGIDDSAAVACEWVQHDDAVFDGDDLDANEVVESFSSNNGGRQSNETWGNAIPEDVVRVEAYDVPVQTPGGVMSTGLTVGWQALDQSVPISEFRLFVAYFNTANSNWGALEHVGSVPSGTYSTTVPLRAGARGGRVRVAIQPVSINGARNRPSACGGTVVELNSLAAKPEAPTDFNIHMEGDKATYTWTAPANSQGLTYEIRQSSLDENEGGWVLAQMVGTTSETQLGPTEWFATASAGTYAGKIRYLLRAKNRHGVYSDVVSVVYGARIKNAVTLTSSNFWYEFATQAWHDYGDGWKTDLGAPTYDPALGSLTRHADGYLTFSSTLTASYTAAGLPPVSPGHFEREQPMRLEAVVFATCRNPTIVNEGNANGNGTFKRDSTPPRQQVSYVWGGNNSVEGHLQEELPTIRIQVKLLRDSDAAGPELSTDTDSDGNDGWLDFTPGVYQCHAAQFRIKLTRPTSEWDVRIYRFWTQTERLLEQRHYRTPSERYLAQELGLG